MSQLQQCFPDILKPAPGLSPAAAYHEATEKVFRAARALDKANEGVVRHQGLLKEATEKAVQAQVPKWEADKAAETARVAFVVFNMLFCFCLFLCVSLLFFMFACF